MTQGKETRRRPLMLVGGGGHCRSVIEAARSAGLEVKGILDLPEHIGEECMGVAVVGSDDDMGRYAGECDFVVTLGSIADASRRVRLHELISKVRGRLGRVVAKTATVSDHASLGEGTVVMHRAVVNAGARVGRGCIINTGAIVEHDATVGDYSHVSTGAIVNGMSSVGSRSFVGSGSVVAHCVNVADGCVIGAGSTVISDLTEAGVYYGTPAKPAKK